MSVLCIVDVQLVWRNDIGILLDGDEWNTILLSRRVLFPCLPPVGTTLFLEVEEFTNLVIKEIDFFEKSDRAGDVPAFHLECDIQDMGTWEAPDASQVLIERVGEFLADGWFLGEYVESAKVFNEWKKFVEEHEEKVLEKKD